mgnify:CR=1 FL=1
MQKEQHYEQKSSHSRNLNSILHQCNARHELNLMFIGEIIDQSVVFIIGTSYGQIMYEEKRGSASFLLVSDLTEAPFIVAVF